MSTLYFYATLPKRGQTPYGGGEVGNMRTVNMLKEAGYTVVPMRQRKARAEWNRFERLVSYPFRLITGWLDVLFTMLFGTRNGIAHLSGFAGATIFNEYVVMHIMKALGYRVVYELRGGGAIGFWDKGDEMYQRMFSYLLRSSCYVFVQGKENIPMLKEICSTPVFHYANCVEDSFAPNELPSKPTDRVNIIFYGRCEENKHVDLIVEATSLVQNEVPNTTLTIVGSGQASYVDQVKAKMKGLLQDGSYTFMPGCKHDVIPSLLMDKHFYLFPSTQPREGQSNSVTECMSYGVIPIASPQGFNRSTIGDDNLIVEDLSATSYAQRIVEIIKGGLFPYYSKQMFETYKKDYSQKVVYERALAVYSTIISD